MDGMRVESLSLGLSFLLCVVCVSVSVCVCVCVWLGICAFCDQSRHSGVYLFPFFLPWLGW